MFKKFIMVLFLAFLFGLPVSNTNAATAQDVTFGTTVTGYITETTDENVYKIVLPNAGKIDINMNSCIERVNANLKDSNGEVLRESDLCGGSEQSPTNWLISVDLEPGTYYFTVWKNEGYGSAGKYYFEVDFNPVSNNDIEPNNDISNAQLLSLNSNPITGYISEKDDQDIYKFELKEAGRVDINMNSCIGWVDINLKDSNGTEIDYIRLSEGSKQRPSRWVPSFQLEAGTYYLTVWKLDEYTGEYTLKATTYKQVNFNSNGGSKVSSQSVLYNTKAIKPTNPTKAGYTFAGWYKENTLVNLFDFGTTSITEDIILYAKWIANPAVPTNMKAASSSYNSVKTTWNAVTGASGYEVYRSTSSTGSYSKIATITGTSYNNTGLTTNKTYYYKIRAYKVVGTTKIYSNFSSVVSAKPVPATPISVKATRSSSTSIKISWAKVTGASGYEVYRSTSKTGTYSSVGTTTSLSYTNSKLTTGKTYYYKVRAYKTVGTTKVYGVWSTVVNAKP